MDRLTTDSAAQRKRLLEALRLAPISTLEARERLDVLHPAARIQELRAEGYRIDTCWTQATTPAGEAHRVALYALQSSTEAA